MLLNININYLANLRNSIGSGEPDILKFSRFCEHSGADGIVVHISDGNSVISNYDVKYIRQHTRTKFILKMPMTQEAKTLALDCKPDTVCIVPQTDEPSPSNGFNALKNQTELNDFMLPLMYEGIVSCVFINPEIDQINSAYKAGMHYVELNTLKYSEAFKYGQFEREYLALKECSVLANTLGMKVSLCKGINYQNVSQLTELHGVSEMTIGHSITTKAIYNGLDSSIKEMKELINEK